MATTSTPVTTPVVPKVSPDVMAYFQAVNKGEIQNKWAALKETHTFKTEWNRLRVVGAVALAIISGVAYKLAHKYAAVVSGALALSALAWARLVVKKETKEFTDLKRANDAAIEALRGAWNSKSEVLCAHFNDQQLGWKVKHADRINTSYNLTTKEELTTLSDDQKEWRKAYIEMLDDVSKVHGNDMVAFEKDEKMNSHYKSQYKKLHEEATRFMTGNFPAPKTYVDVKEENGKTVAKAWEIEAKKV